MPTSRFFSELCPFGHVRRRTVLFCCETSVANRDDPQFLRSGSGHGHRTSNRSPSPPSSPTAENRLVTCAASEFIASRIPGAQLYLFDGKGHNPMFSATDEFCDVLRNFIRTGRAERTFLGSAAA